MKILKLKPRKKSLNVSGSEREVTLTPPTAPHQQLLHQHHSFHQADQHPHHHRSHSSFTYNYTNGGQHHQQVHQQQLTHRALDGMQCWTPSNPGSVPSRCDKESYHFIYAMIAFHKSCFWNQAFCFVTCIFDEQSNCWFTILYWNLSGPNQPEWRASPILGQ